ncbi:hypothetical protein [Streptomyces sp. NPDC020917]|uniref:hypothetical protein n=1 Tax=Streptomyces sp. NPDC020917 TaxID=3365102 RepID=UPI0037A03773
MRPRRRGRTTLLIASAAVLGVLAGGGLGYRIQQQRTPTPLPPLTGRPLAQPNGAGPAAAALPVSQDRAAVYGGDLLKLLVPTPKGAKEGERGWESLAAYSENFTKPGTAFVEFSGDDFQRAVNAMWLEHHDTVVSVELAQFRDDAAPSAPRRMSDQSLYNDADDELADGEDVPGTMDGKVWGSAKPHRIDGSVTAYSARGMARIGNIVVDVSFISARPVKAATVAALVTRQLERL